MQRSALSSTLHGWELELNVLGYSGTDGGKKKQQTCPGTGCRVSGGKEKELLSRSNTLAALP